MPPLSTEQDSLQPITTAFIPIMTPQQFDADAYSAANSSQRARSDACDSLTASRSNANVGNHNNTIEVLPFALPDSLGSPIHVWGDNDANENSDDDSQSCEWSVASSESSVSWDDNNDEEEDDDNEDLSKELDDYLDLCMQKQQEERPRLVKFSESAPDVHQYETVAREYHKDMYYTVHELQRMIDDFVSESEIAILGC